MKKQDYIPRFRRFPASGERDPITGLSPSTLNNWRKRGFIKTAIVRDPGTKRGLVFLDGVSIDEFLASRIAAPGDTASDCSAAVSEWKRKCARRRNEKKEGQ